MIGLFSFLSGLWNAGFNNKDVMILFFFFFFAAKELESSCFSLTDFSECAIPIQFPILLN